MTDLNILLDLAAECGRDTSREAGDLLLERFPEPPEAMPIGDWEALERRARGLGIDIEAEWSEIRAAYDAAYLDVVAEMRGACPVCEVRP